MKKTYITPDVQVIVVAADGILCQGSAKGGYDGNSITKENEENMVKGYNYSGNSVQWDDWD